MIAAAALAFIFGHAQRKPAARPAAPLPLCVTAEAKLLKTLSSRRNNSGDVFDFKTIGSVVGNGRDVPDLRPGTPGYGVVMYAMHARMQGGAGFFILEPRYLSLHGGRRLSAMADPRLDDEIVAGASRDAPGVLGFVPIVGWAAAGYNALHRGREVVIPAGTQFRLILGDDMLEHRCADPPASD